MSEPDLEQWLPLTPAVFFVLLSLASGTKHGYAIMQEVASVSDGKVRMGPGTLYATIQRLAAESLIVEVAREPDSGRRRRYYELTRAGRTLLEAEVARMDSMVRVARSRKLEPRPIS